MSSDVIRFSTEGMGQREAKEYWADHVGDACHGVQCDFRDVDHFSASTEYVDFGFGKVTQFWLSDIQAQRLPFHISRDGLEILCLSLIRKGNGKIYSNSDELYWRPGDVYCNPISNPFQAEMKGPVEFVTLYFEKSWIRSIGSVPTGLFFNEISTISGWGKAIAEMMLEISPKTMGGLALPAADIAENIAGLLALCAGPDAAPLRASGRSLLDRLRSDMRDRLSSPALSPTGFAAEHGISVRTLHLLFCATGTSFMAELWTMRLERSRALLANRRLDSKSISEIAALAGFSNADHFTARFRKAYGMSPTKYRQGIAGK
ncbi:AraC family transcriptional regulator [Nitrospirillum sp. BR 11828]|uniref:helix-turn-helix domain-containing protein n=1 Tax=Nitrospirillum sp. BR 11828 TaxID=3104325 RepID=UPI002ACAE564|nr:AraC family transcriptional regulator [Nitrospirillum sp. BR 11828]MDZ5650184.1 AraC family transcriptional regulator [Nitrospirillum sp. BR 11828]